METLANTKSGTSGGGGGAAMNADIEDFLVQLDLNDEAFDDMVISEDDPEINESVRWLALAWVHTDKTFSQAAFYRDMRAAWNPAQHVRFRPVGPNLFFVQASCLGDWERMVEQGPWLFRNWVVLMVRMMDSRRQMQFLWCSCRFGSKFISCQMDSVRRA